MLITKPTTVVVEDSSARIDAAEVRGESNGLAIGLGLLAIVVVALVIGYFAWWAPANSTVVQSPVIEHDTTTIEKPVPGNSPTIINTAPSVTPPTVIHEDHVVQVPPPTTPPPATNNTGSNNGSGSDSGNGGSSTSGNGSTGSTTGN